MKKICILQQEAGIGDIIFCQGIAKIFLRNDYRVVWPISPSILHVSEYLDKNIEFYDNTQDFPLKDYFLSSYEKKKILFTENQDCFIPLGYSSHMIQPIKSEIMQSKYRICNLDWKIWKKELEFNRNLKKENELFYDVLGLKDNQDYLFLNQNYVTQPHNIKKNITHLANNFPSMDICEMRFVEGFTLFDWCKVFENMHSTLTVDTSLMYILEKLNLKNKTNFLCVTRSPHTEKDIKELFNIPWKYIHA
jgi:hypothetical protein